ncbi:MAG: ubiquinol-cytochrome c reductase iron-sulfur subunit [Caldimicrobium sp.]
MKRREFFKVIGLTFLGFLGIVSLRTLSFLSKPSPKKIFISKGELEKIKDLHLYEEIILVRKGATLSVYSRRCPHLGCKLNYDPEREIILCPCHQSKFNLLGKYLEGPAKKDLKKLPFEIREEGLSIEIS